MVDVATVSNESGTVNLNSPLNSSMTTNNPLSQLGPSDTTDNNKVTEKLSRALGKRNFELAAQIVESMDVAHIKDYLINNSISPLRQNVPYSLVALQSIYSRLFVCNPDALSFAHDLLKPKETTMAIVKYFFCAQTSKKFASSLDASYEKYAQKIIRIVGCVSPQTVATLRTNRESIRRHVQGLSSHGLVCYNDEMLHLHEALYMELCTLIRQYKQALNVLQVMNLISRPITISSNHSALSSASSSFPLSPGSPKKSSSPTRFKLLPSPKSNSGERKRSSVDDVSHQKLLDVSSEDIQQRLYKNKAFLNVIEPSFKTSPIADLYGSLCERVDLDKDILVLSNQISKDTGIPISHSVKLGTRLLSYLSSVEKVLGYMRESSCGGDGNFTTSDNPELTEQQSESGYSSSSTRSVPNFRSKNGDRSKAAEIGLDGLYITEESGGGGGMGGVPKRYRKRHRSPKGSRTSVILNGEYDCDSSPMSSVSVNGSSSSVAPPITSPGGGSGSESNSSPVIAYKNKNRKRLQGQNVNGGLNGSSSNSNSTVPTVMNDLNQQQHQQLVDGSSGLGVGGKEEPPTPNKSNTPRSMTTSPFSRNAKLNSSSNQKRHSSSHSQQQTQSVEEQLVLRQQISQLQTELNSANQMIRSLQQREEQLMERLSEQVRRKVETSGSFETLNDANRPSQLIQRYSDLYCEFRPDAMDALDDIIGINFNDEEDTNGDGDQNPSGNSSNGVDSESHCNDLKQKILFSIVVLSFRSVQRSIEEITRQIYVLLGINDVDPNISSSNETLSGENNLSSSFPNCNSSLSNSDKASSAASEDQELKQLISDQLRKSASSRKTECNFEEVCQQLWTTLYDYPALKQSTPLLNYIRECVKLAWLLLLSNPVYHIIYHHSEFDENFLNRFHTSDLNSNSILAFIWPALVEQTTGHCVSKGIVVT